MNIYTYKTSGGKDLIFEYIDNLPKFEAEKHELQTAVNRAKELG